MVVGEWASGHRHRRITPVETWRSPDLACFAIDLEVWIVHSRAWSRSSRSQKRDREAASASAAAAAPEEDERCELATKRRRRAWAGEGNDKNKDGGDDVNIQGTLADIDEEGENDLEYEFESGPESQPLEIDAELAQAARREKIECTEGWVCGSRPPGTRVSGGPGEPR